MTEAGAVRPRWLLVADGSEEEGPRNGRRSSK